MGCVGHVYWSTCHSCSYLGEEERPHRGDHIAKTGLVLIFHQVILAGTTSADAPYVLTPDVNPDRPPVGLVPLGEGGYGGQVNVSKCRRSLQKTGGDTRLLWRDLENFSSYDQHELHYGSWGYSGLDGKFYHQVPSIDGAFGTKLDDGTWNGMASFFWTNSTKSLLFRLVWCGEGRWKLPSLTCTLRLRGERSSTSLLFSILQSRQTV